MNSSCARSVAALAALLCSAAPSAAVGQQVGARADARPDIIRAALRMDFVSRNYELDNEEGTISFDAPMYPGIRLGLEAFPIATFAPDSAAAGLGVQVEFGKHDVSTVTDIVEPGQDPITLDIPTRHDTSWFALLYEWNAAPGLLVIPHIGWRAVEYALAYNPLYQNTFYQGVEIGAGARYELVDGFSLAGAVGVRPAVSLGSTATVWGASASAFGFSVDAGGRYRSRTGLFADAGIRYESYATDYEPGPDDTTRTTASDSFFSLLLSVGFAY
jgi:hypothetical protein